MAKEIVRCIDFSGTMHVKGKDENQIKKRFQKYMEENKIISTKAKFVPVGKVVSITPLSDLTKKEIKESYERMYGVKWS